VLSLAEVGAFEISFVFQVGLWLASLFSVFLRQDFDIAFHVRGCNLADFVLEMGQVLLLNLRFLFSASVCEGVDTGSNVLWFLLHRPIVLIRNFLHGASTPARYPVFRDLVVDESRSLSARCHSALFSKLLPLGLRRLHRARLLSRQDNSHVWHHHTVVALSVLQNFSIGSVLSSLLLLDVKQGLVELAKATRRALRELLHGDSIVALRILDNQTAYVHVLIQPVVSLGKVRTHSSWVAGRLIVRILSSQDFALSFRLLERIVFYLLPWHFSFIFDNLTRHI